MKESTKRTLTRWIHVVFSIPIVGYVYSPFAELPNYARRSVCLHPCAGPDRTVDVEKSSPATTRFEELPLIACTGEACVRWKAIRG